MDKYNFKEQREEIELAREKANSEQDLERVINRWNAFNNHAVKNHNPVELVNGCVHQEITYSHLRERTNLRLYSGVGFGFIQAALVIAQTYEGPDGEKADEKQIYRRLGDHAHEAEDYAEALRCYLLSEKDHPEYSAPLGRALVFTGKVESGLKLLTRALSSAQRRNRKPTWHTRVVLSGVLMKYAESLVKVHGITHKPKYESKAKQLMLKAKRLCEALDAEGFHQRRFQWDLLNLKLNLFPFASRR